MRGRLPGWTSCSAACCPVQLFNSHVGALLAGRWMCCWTSLMLRPAAAPAVRGWETQAAVMAAAAARQATAAPLHHPRHATGAKGLVYGRQRGHISQQCSWGDPHVANSANTRRCALAASTFATRRWAARSQLTMERGWSCRRVAASCGTRCACIRGHAGCAARSCGRASSSQAYGCFADSKLAVN